MTVAEPRSRNVTSTEVLVAGMVLCALGGTWMRDGVAGNGRLATAGTVFCGVFLQAVPFLVLGVLISGLVATFVSPERLTRWLPRRSVGAVLTAGVARSGAARLRVRVGARGAATLWRRVGWSSGADVHAQRTGDQPGGAWWPPRSPSPANRRWCSPDVWRRWQPRWWWVCCGLRWGRLSWITRTLPQSQHNDASRWTVFTEAARHDFLQAASYLVIGAAAAASCESRCRRGSLNMWRVIVLVGVVTMALLAFVLALCSEADAFVAASLTMVPLLPRLVFLVVGPAVDVKLVAMQAGLFGRAFALRFAPLTLVVATVVATVVGLVLL